MASHHILAQVSSYVKIQPQQALVKIRQRLPSYRRNVRSSMIWFVQSSVGLLVIIDYTVQSITGVTIFEFHRNDSFSGFIFHIIAKFFFNECWKFVISIHRHVLLNFVYFLTVY
jgi:hypothetical protein